VGGHARTLKRQLDQMSYLQDAPDWVRAAVSQPRSDHAVESDGAQLHVAGWNAREVDKPPLLFVHGFRANAHWWDHIAPYFVERHRVFALDLSGMGSSARRRLYTPEHYIGDIVAVGRSLKNAAPRLPLTVVGHSFGGSRTLEACALEPDLIARAVVLDSMFRLHDDQPVPRQQLGRPEPYPDEASVVARFRLLPEQPADPWLKAYIAYHSVARVPGGWSWRFDMQMPATLDFGAGEPLLQAIRNPVDLIRGEHSIILDERRADRIAALLEKVRGPIVIPEAHHHLMLDQPLALISVLRTLLA
jgi:pimeloyl-ACP methyl ester carboxylesterase